MGDTPSFPFNPRDAFLCIYNLDNDEDGHFGGLVGCAPVGSVTVGNPCTYKDGTRTESKRGSLEWPGSDAVTILSGTINLLLPGLILVCGPQILNL